MKFRLGRRKPKNVQAVLRGWRAYLHLLMLGGAIAMHVAPARADLPVPCGGGSCGGQVWVAAGRVQVPVITGNTMRITQESDKAILNWASFNIGQGQQVQFAQPSSSAIALNRIYQLDPSRIEGQLNANGQIYLINQNGIIFGSGAQVNVNSLTASTLDVDDKVFSDVGLARVLQVQGDAAFKAKGAMGAIRIEQGAELKSADGGRIMIFAPVVDNAGKIETPNGQTVLAAAKDKVYLATSDDLNLRGLLVEVAGGGDLTHSGNISAAHGNVSLLGFAINQNGVVSASTSVRVNGSIRLLAREVDSVTLQNGSYVITSTRSERGGTSSKVTFGTGSVTEVLPDLADKTTAVDEQPRQRSTVEVTAKQIRLDENALIHATSGKVTLTASKTPNQPATNGTVRNDSRIELAPNSRIDVAGTTSTVLPMERNEVTVELRANELHDSPLQRDGVLRGKKVVVDVRKGTPLADVSGAVAGIQRDIGERSSKGGDVSLTSEGDLIVRQGAVVDVSGGSVRYQEGYINTTKLLAQGKLVDIGDADPKVHYDAVLGQYSRTDHKWGVTQNWTMPGMQTQGVFEPGYVQGAAAGTINLKSSALRLDGELRGGVQAGPYQRDAAHLPAGGALTIDLANLGRPGLAYPAAGLRFATGLALTADEAQRGLDPSNTVLVSPDMLQRGGLATLTVNSVGVIDLPADAALHLPAGGHLTLSGKDVRVNGAIDIPAGTVTVSGGQGAQIVLNDGARIDVRGRWVNDNPLLSDARPSDALLIDGGVVALSTGGDLLLRPGSVIDAGGGAWADSNGHLHGGKGGSISLKTDFPGGSKLELGAELRAYAPHEGGVLDITANSLRIDQPGAPPPSRPDPNELLFTPDFFQRGGFRSYRLNANLNSITVAGGTEILPRMQNVQFDGDYTLRPSDSALTLFTHTVSLPDYQRAPVDVSLSLQRNAATGVNTGRVELQEGSVIRTDPGAVVSLTSDASLIVNGRIEAPAGKIDLTLIPVASSNEAGYLAGQGIWLGPQAQLLAPSQLQLIPDDQGLRRGELLPGGEITLKAERGYIVTAAGSAIDVSGGETQLDVESVPGETAPASLTPSRHRVIASAGSITLTAAEGMLLDGDLRGHAPADAAAGSLQIALDTAERSEPDTPLAAPARNFLYGPRRIELRADGTPSIPIGLQQGAAISDAYNGRALLDARLIRQGGFDEVMLRASNTFKPNDKTTPVATAEIRFGDGVDLHLARGLAVDAPALRGEGQVRLAAPYVTLGSSNVDSQQGATSSAGSARLQVDAEQAMDIVGALGLRGFGEVHLNSGGDLRLRGVQVGGTANELTGSLNANGLLALRAGQIYPSTLSHYRIDVGGSDSRLITSRSNGSDTPVLSAGSDLSLHATHIEHGGVLKAPLGAIHLQADDDLHLLPASVVSVSAENQDILFGVTQFGVDWLYGLRDRNLLFGAMADPKQNRQALPDKRIELNGRAVSLEAGATLDVSGGGDLLAYEFIPGPGGSRDVLAPDNAGNSFAILPRLNNALAPYDPMASAGVGAAAGAAVHLTEGSGVPAGDYTIMPARYALLPGAYLVTPVAGAQDIQPGMPATRADNTPIVAGYYTVAGAAIRDDGRWRGFVVESSDIVKQRSEYKISEASKFFVDASSAAARLPQDAGRVQIQTTDSLLLAGQLRAATGSGGRGSALDISADDINIVASPDPNRNGVQITAAGLNQLGAESLLIGGRRSAGGNDLNVDAASVRVASGAELQGREILLVATQRVTLESGARVDTSGVGVTANEPLHVSGDSAVLRAANGPQRELLRTGNSNGRAMLDIQAGAHVTAGGSLLLDSSGDAALNGDITMQGGSLAIGAAHINLGAASQRPLGVVLQQSLLDGLHVDDLSLRSSDGIDIYGNLTLNTRRLTIDAAGLYGHDNAGASVLLKADEVRFGNSHNAAAPHLHASSDAHLVIDSQRLVLNRGDFSLQGYGKTQINAARELYFNGNGHTQVDGDLQLNVGGISAAAGTDAGVDTQGALHIAALTSGNVTPPGLGARLEFTAKTIDDQGRIVLPAGEVTMNGRDGVTLAPGSLIDVSGTVQQFADQTIAAPAGRITLTSTQGNIVLASGARLDMHAATGGDAGELQLSAPSGAVQLAGDVFARADPGRRGGRVTLDVDHLGNFSAFNQTFNQAGFSDGRELHVRNGDVNIAAGDIVKAKNVSLIVDGGGIDVRGSVISEVGKGRVALYGRDDVKLESGALLRAVNGAVELGTTRGKISLNDGAYIDVAAQNGDATGTVRLRAPRIDNNGDGIDDDVAVDAIHAGVTGAAQLTVEAFRRYDAGTVSDTGVYQSDTEQYMAQAPTIEARLGANAHVQAGVELASRGNLTLSNDWNLASWRYNGRPGVLTLRAAGNLYLGANLNDGFDLNAGVDPLSGASVDVLRSDASWSYRLIGGADLTSADPLATGNSGDVTVGPGARVRTGTGAIDVAAGRNVVLADGNSTLYTAGVSTGVGTFPADYLSILMPGEYPIHGGNVHITAAGDVRGALPTQFITDWLHRMGGADPSAGDVPTVWSIDFGRYHMGMGALGGGDVSIQAGGAISDLAVMLPTTGQHRGDVSVATNGNLRFTDNNVLVQGGGDLAIDAGGDIRGGVFYLGRGQGEIRSGGALGLDSVGKLYPILALAEGKYDLTSRGELNLETAVNPTLLKQNVEQSARAGFESNFFSYSADSGVTLTSLAGDVHLRNDTVAMSESSMQSLSRAAGDSDGWTSVYPGSLRARALQGDIEVNNSFRLFPSARGTLELLAHGNVSGISHTGGVTVNLSDTDPTQLPSVNRPSASLQDAVTRLPASGVGDAAMIHAATPVHQQDVAPARIVAAHGDVFGDPNSGGLFALYLSKPVYVSAGGDVRDVSLNVQNLRATDVSVVQAGRDIRFNNARNDKGNLLGNPAHILVSGPGRIDVLAGRDIDLGSSDGIVTIGNGLNPMLPPGGADVVVQAGVPPTANYDAFIRRYLVNGADYRELLVSYMQTRRMNGTDNDLDAFLALPREQQRALVMEIFFHELQAGGRKAANSGNSADYRRGYDAIATLYPPSDARGDLRMYFSRIHTVDGGNIYSSVPTGMIDVGVAAAVGFTKSTDQLGIVALQQGSVNVFVDKNMMVNQSRVFAMDGGDILIWSSHGNIDAGRGAKTALAAPSAKTDYDKNGNAITIFPPTVTGSGIRAFVSTPGRAPGNVDLFAPVGVVNAGDAGIGSAGNVTIGAVQVLGADNIDVGGVAVGVPLGDTNVLSGALASLGDAVSAATKTVEETAKAAGEQKAATPMSDAALRFLEVEVTGFGEENENKKNQK